jgi:hypothetical protein
MFNGEPGAVPKVIGHWMLRAGLMMPGLALAGVRDKRLITGALLSSSFVSLFLIAYTGFERQRHRRRQMLAARRRRRGHLAGSDARKRPYKRPAKEREPVYFVDPNTGEYIELDQRTAEYKKLGRRVRGRLAGRGQLAARYRVTVNYKKFPTPTSLCVEARDKAEATAMVQGNVRGAKIVRVVRGC